MIVFFRVAPAFRGGDCDSYGCHRGRLAIAPSAIPRARQGDGIATGGSTTRAENGLSSPRARYEFLFISPDRTVSSCNKDNKVLALRAYLRAALPRSARGNER